MKMLLQRLVAVLVRPTLRGNEDSEELLRKKLLIPFTVVLFIVFTIDTLRKGITTSYLPVIEAVVVALCAVFLANTYATSAVTPLQGNLFIYLITLFGTYGKDVVTRGVFDVWCASIVGVDALMLTNTSSAATGPILVMVVVYGIFNMAAASNRSVMDSMPKEDNIPDENLPVDYVFQRLFLQTFVFFIDFIMTRSFAAGMRREREKAIRSAELANRVADLLARFDLDEAEELVHESDSALSSAFAELLANLRMYRPYLPDTLFAERSFLQAETVVKPPMGPEATLIFTDIQSSTELWETCPVPMRRALEIHNTTIRRLLTAHGGFEVKTIGDSFMAAFPSPQPAMAFALEAQESLYRARWPQDLFANSLCAEDGPWRGLRVRIAMHCGPVDVEVNPVTGRPDYFGTTVNTAARIEGAIPGGYIAASTEVVREIDLDSLGQPMMETRGVVTLRGLEKGVSLHVLVPRTLAGRLLPENTGTADSGSSSFYSGSLGSATNPLARQLVPSELTWTSGTVANVLSSHEDEGTFTNTVASIIRSAEQCEGIVISTFGASVIVTWNTAKRCFSHATQAARFAAYVSSRTLTTGVCSGSLGYGNVGTATTRFVAVLGSSIDLSLQFARKAFYYRAKIFVGSIDGLCSAASDPVMRNFSRPVLSLPLSSLVVVSESADVITVHEFDGARWLSEGEDMFLGWSGCEVSWAWSVDYARAFHKSNVHEIMAKAGKDPVLQVVCRELERHAHMHDCEPDKSSG